MFKRLYDPVLSWSLNHGHMAIFFALGSLIGAGILLTQASKSFTPTVDVADLIVQLEKLSSIALEQSIDVDLPVERSILNNVSEISSIVASTGVDERGLDPMGLNETAIFLVLKPPKQWQLAAKSDVKQQTGAVLTNFPGIAPLNGSVMVTYFNELRAVGLIMEQVVREGAI